MRLIGRNALLLVFSNVPGLGMKETLAMGQLNGIYPVASDALYNLQIGVTAYCISWQRLQLVMCHINKFNGKVSSFDGQLLMSNINDTVRFFEQL